MLALELQDSKCLVFVLRILWTLPSQIYLQGP